MTNIAKLALEDGTVFTGTAFGAVGEVDGEVCFNTSMTGYQEILDRPELSRPNRLHDLSGNWQLRREFRRRGKSQAALGGLHCAAVELGGRVIFAREDGWTNI